MSKNTQEFYDVYHMYAFVFEYKPKSTNKLILHVKLNAKNDNKITSLAN